MLKLALGMRSNTLARSKNTQGFSLLEILVVVVIISITMTFALLSFGDFGQKRHIIVAGEQFANYFKLVQQQAILEASTLGIKLDPKGYQVFRYGRTGHWQKMAEKGVFSSQTIPKSAFLAWETNHHTKNDPEIIINASGDSSPFTLFFKSQNNTTMLSVYGNHNGDITLKPVDNDE